MYVGTFSPKMNNWRENPLQYYFNKNKISPGWQRTKDEKNGLLTKIIENEGFSRRNKITREKIRYNMISIKMKYFVVNKKQPRKGLSR